MHSSRGQAPRRACDRSAEADGAARRGRSRAARLHSVPPSPSGTPSPVPTEATFTLVSAPNQRKARRADFDTAPPRRRRSIPGESAFTRGRLNSKSSLTNEGTHRRVADGIDRAASNAAHRDRRRCRGRPHGMRRRGPFRPFQRGSRRREDRDPDDDDRRGSPRFQRGSRCIDPCPAPPAHLTTTARRRGRRSARWPARRRCYPCRARRRRRGRDHVPALGRGRDCGFRPS